MRDFSVGGSSCSRDGLIGRFLVKSALVQEMSRDEPPGGLQHVSACNVGFSSFKMF